MGMAVAGELPSFDACSRTRRPIAHRGQICFMRWWKTTAAAGTSLSRLPRPKLPRRSCRRQAERIRRSSLEARDELLLETDGLVDRVIVTLLRE